MKEMRDCMGIDLKIRGYSPALPESPAMFLSHIQGKLICLIDL